MDALLFKATTLPDAWFQLVYALVKGETARNVYEIDKGSYVGQRRLEFPYVTVQIDQPGARPLIPEMPPMLNIPAPVDGMDYVNDYFARYLMGTELAENETYIYGTWLAPGVERVIRQLQGAPGNNQAAICIGGWAPQPRAAVPEGGLPEGLSLALDTDNFIDPGTGERDPACLRVVDFRLDQQNTLHMSVYFRSWDLWSGFPANLAGLQLVKEYVAQYLGAQDGRIIAASKGLHIYDHAVEIAATRLGMSDVASMDDFVAWLGKETEP
ncbi:MAG: thymidylate synthase [bacterium]